MRRALVLGALLVSTAAHAEDAVVPEDPKAALAARGIVLKAGKRHFIVIVPAATKQEHDDPSAMLYRATFYFGDTKTLFKVPSGSFQISDPTSESIDLVDPREIYDAKIFRNGESFTLQCADFDGFSTNKRTIELTAAEAKTTALVAKAPLKPLFRPYVPFLLMRIPKTTQYLYVDRNVKADSQDFRLFLGKRGAMKQIPVKEVAHDSTALVLETAKGTLAADLSKQKASATATWGPSKNPHTVEVVPLHVNRKLIQTELGIYTRVRMGYPCDEL